MRLLFLTNFYPPHGYGGYEQWCQEVALGLHALGHELYILTSSHRRSDELSPTPFCVARDLYLQVELSSPFNGIQFFVRRRAREAWNLACLRNAVKTFQPEAILIWGMWNLSRSLPALAETLMGDSVAYYVGDYWLTLPSQFTAYWQAPARMSVSALPKRILGSVACRQLRQEQRPELELRHLFFPSRFMCDELLRRNVDLRGSSIIYGGVDVDLFKSLQPDRTGANHPDLRMLYAGRLTQEKGVHTAIDALAVLVHARGLDNVTLNIVGGGETHYVTRLHELVKRRRVDDHVTFTAALHKEAMTDIYAASDVLLFTSIWPEPFGRVIIEAMAAGLAVIGTATGGAGEILDHGRNSLVFAPENPDDLADKIALLAEAPALRFELAAHGQNVTAPRFDIRRMTREIEAKLHAIRIRT